jgi:hypothetical protein
MVAPNIGRTRTLRSMPEQKERVSLNATFGAHFIPPADGPTQSTAGKPCRDVQSLPNRLIDRTGLLMPESADEAVSRLGELIGTAHPQTDI